MSMKRKNSSLVLMVSALDLMLVPLLKIHSVCVRCARCSATGSLNGSMVVGLGVQVWILKGVVERQLVDLASKHVDPTGAVSM